VVLSLTTHEQVLANGLSWAYSVTTRNAQKQESKGTVTFSVNSAITNIEDEKEIITIDYSNNILYRYDKRSEKCSCFPLSTSSSPQYSKEDNALQLSNFRLFSTDKSQKTSHHTCRLKQILFGADFAKFQTVVPPTTKAFGQIFTESMVSYCVSTDVAGFNSMFAIAKQHSGFFESNLFLRRIDIIGLFEILYGFPVQIIKTANNIKTILSLIDEPQPINNVVIPEQCQ
jgi:hypothetical protein